MKPQSPLNNSSKMISIITSDAHKALHKFEIFEKQYLQLDSKGKKYLKSHSKLYKQELNKIQKIIYPFIQKICTNCENHCCHLLSPKRSIYIANTTGGFQFSDYLLVRYNTKLPEPVLTNIKKNLCPFWNNGCILPLDCRSYICLKWFCENLEKQLDMKNISKHLKKIKKILNDFSIPHCLDLK